MDELKRNFSRNLTRLLSERNMTQGEFASKMGYNRTTVNTWCTGSAFPSTHKLQEVADYFGVGKSFLLEEYNSVESNASLLRRLTAYALLLNVDGVKKLEERAEELAELPKYKREEKKDVD